MREKMSNSFQGKVFLFNKSINTQTQLQISLFILNHNKIFIC